MKGASFFYHDRPIPTTAGMDQPGIADWDPLPAPEGPQLK